MKNILCTNGITHIVDSVGCKSNIGFFILKHGNAGQTNIYTSGTGYLNLSDKTHR